MRKKKRKWDELSDEDPAAGLINLFDVWIAFAVALLLAIVSYDSMTRRPDASQTMTVIKKEGTPEMEILTKEGTRIEHYRASPETMGGDGERLGTAYRLKSGEVIYVPEPAKPGAPGGPGTGGTSRSSSN